MEEDLPLLVMRKQRGKVRATLQPQAGDSRGGCGATGTGGRACIKCRSVAEAGDAGNRSKRECKY